MSADTPGERNFRRDEVKRGKDERAEARREAIRTFMAERGWSQKEWCDMAGLDNASALGNFLSGHARSLNLETLEPLARAAGVTVSQLIGETSNQPEKTAGVAQVVVSGDTFNVSVTVPVDVAKRVIGTLLTPKNPS